MPFFNVVILIFTRNCVDSIRRTLDSCLTQTFDSRRIKIVVVDNNSTDGTYEKVLEYVSTTSVAVYRLCEQRFATRLLRAADRILEFVEYKYIAVLSPGDIIYPNYVERCTAVMEQHATLERGLLISETDVIDPSGIIARQLPIYTESGVLMKRIHYTEFFTTGVGRKIQCFAIKRIFPKVLPDIPFCVEYADWFMKAIYAMNMECIYMKDALSATATIERTDMLNQMMLRLFLVKRMSLIRGTIFAEDTSSVCDDEDTQRRISENLAALALEYACQALVRKEFKVVKDLLLYAEMVFGEIVGSELYCLLRDSVLNGSCDVCFDAFRRDEQSVPLPHGAMSLAGMV